MDFEFELARPEDDPALRRLLANTPMPGRLTVAFEREPDYFLGCGTMGRSWQIVVARLKSTGEIVGVLCRGVRPHFINGRPVNIGYIGQIRIAEKYRGLWLLQRGLRFFRQLHADGQAPGYWGVISDENAVARGVLVERSRKNFPVARQLARLHTLGIILRRPLQGLPFAGTIEPGSVETLPEIVAFLRQEGARRQLYPAYDEQDFTGSPATLGFDLRDFRVARQDGVIRGVIGLWDQAGYKQSVVRGFDRSLQLVRPFYNLGARLAGAAPLPGIGEHIHSAYASFICVANDDRPVFAALLRAVCNLAAERRYAYLMLGLAELDPLLPEGLRYAHISYFSRLYVGYWPEEAGEFFERLDGRTPYIEIAML
jgi:hypothetical protein